MFENLNSLISKKQKIYKSLFRLTSKSTYYCSFYCILLNVRAEGEGEEELGLGLRLRLGLELGLG